MFGLGPTELIIVSVALGVPLLCLLTCFSRRHSIKNFGNKMGTAICLVLLSTVLLGPIGLFLSCFITMFVFMTRGTESESSFSES